MDLVKLHKDSRDLLERLAARLAPEKVTHYRTLSDVGEWIELVDLMCATLVKGRIPVTPQERDSLAALLAMFEGPREGYAYVSDPERVLSQLTVVPT